MIVSPASGGPSSGSPVAEPGPVFGVLGTPLVITDCAGLSDWCHRRTRQSGAVALEFTNTQIVTARRHDPRYRVLTDAYDYFLPDSKPIQWCLQRQRTVPIERVYGPTFMRECLARTAPEYSHYLIGGSPDCAARLRARFPGVHFVGGFHGWCEADGTLAGDAGNAVITELDRLAPDFIWVGLGTPKQDAWVHRHKTRVRRGLLLSVGYAFDVNAGMKPDIPTWMQRTGLGWCFRLASEPRRLFGRYLKYNSLFLAYLMWDGVRGRAWARAPG